MKRLALALVAAACVQGAAVAATAADCQPRPFDGRDLYLRGSFNTWNAVEAQRFTWACNRFELVTRIEGEQRFNVISGGRRG